MVLGCVLPTLPSRFLSPHHILPLQSISVEMLCGFPFFSRYASAKALIDTIARIFARSCGGLWAVTHRRVPSEPGACDTGPMVLSAVSTFCWVLCADATPASSGILRSSLAMLDLTYCTTTEWAWSFRWALSRYPMTSSWMVCLRASFQPPMMMAISSIRFCSCRASCGRA